MAIWGYVRVSTEEQHTENQKLIILEYANKNNLTVNNWIEIKTGSRKSKKERKINELLRQVEKGDTLIVAELSRLGRSVGQVVTIINEFIQKKVKVICLKEDINLIGRPSMQNKVMITMFSLFAEIERDLISERTKEGLARARADGKLLGRPKGTLGKSKLDSKENEIKNYLQKGVNKANIAKIYEVSWPTIDNFIKTRRL